MTAVRNLAIVALVVGLLLGGVVGWASSGDDAAPAVAATPMGAADAEKAATTAEAAAAPEAEQSEPADDAPAADPRGVDRSALSGALSKGVKDAARSFDGAVEAAIWAEGWDAPVVRAVRRGDAVPRTSSRTELNLWSTSKAVTAVTLLRELAGRAPDAGLRRAMKAALTASENCPQRRMVLELQKLLGGPAAAATAIAQTLGDAGANPGGVGRSAAPPDDATCVQRLTTRFGWTGKPTEPALQLGIGTWTVRDAVSFVHHLATGGYGDAGDRVLALLGQPKRRSSELTVPEQFTATPDWGAGAAFDGVATPAYKAGWGGATNPRRAFAAGQIVAVTVGGVRYAIAVYFLPRTKPSDDDPGKTKAPEALEVVLDPIVRKLRGPGAG